MALHLQEHAVDHDALPADVEPLQAQHTEFGFVFNKIFEIVANLLLNEIRRRSCADSEHQSFSLKWIDGLCVKVELVV